MAINLVEAVQTKLGYSPLHKIDPNTQEIIKDDQPVNLLAQAAIPAVLISIYKASTEVDELGALVRRNSSAVSVGNIFGDNYDSVVEKIAAYSNTSVDEVSAELEKVATASQSVLSENLKDADGAAIKSFFGTQASNLKMYLPAALQMGDELNDNTLDDRTHKMSGPVSGAMHFIESLFSDSDNQKKPDNPTDDTVNYKS